MSEAQADSGASKYDEVVELQTSVKPKTLNPVWNEKFTFYGLPNPPNIQFKVFDHDLVGDHDFLGQLKISHLKLEEQQELDEWFDLSDDDGRVGGRLHLKVSFLEDQVPRINLSDGKRIFVTVEENVVKVSIKLTARGATPDSLPQLRKDQGPDFDSRYRISGQQSI
eukprot:763875-Hanusia_phi.AAC.3